MSLIEIKKVESKKDLKTFIDFHYDLYEGNEYDVPNLFSDEMNTLSPDKNAAFEFARLSIILPIKMENWQVASLQSSIIRQTISGERSPSASDGLISSTTVRFRRHFWMLWRNMAARKAWRMW